MRRELSTKITTIVGGVLCLGAVITGLGFAIRYETNNYYQQLQELAHQNKPIVGTVIAESYVGTAVPELERENTKTNDFSKLQSKYTLTVKIDNGRTIGLSIIDSEAPNVATKESLDAIVEQGTRIQFPRGNIYAVDANREYCTSNSLETAFSAATQFGTKPAHRVTVLGK